MKIAIFGSSGFAREVADIAIACGYRDIVYLSPEDAPKHSKNIKIVDETHNNIQNLRKKGFTFAIAISESKIRKKISEKYPDLNFPNLLHPTVTFGLHQEEQIAKTRGNIIASGCRVSNSIQFGNFGIFNFGTTIAHDCDIGNYVSIMPGSIISGNVSIGDQVFIGAGAIIIQGKSEQKLSIGCRSFVGIGSVVIGNIKEDTKVFGNPAKKSF